MRPSVYLEYLKTKKWVPQEELGDKLILSFMPTGFPNDIWEAGTSEKFFLGRIRHLADGVEVLSSFGIGAPAARTHLALAIEAGVKEVISVGTVGSLNADLSIGQRVLLNSGDLDSEILGLEKLPQVRTSTVFDVWDPPDSSADVVEMEAEKLFAWCQERAVKLSCIGVVSDLVKEDSWEPGFHAISDSLGQAHRLAYEALIRKGH